MKRSAWRLVFAFGLAATARVLSGAEPGSGPPPLLRAHAHNDYEHARPLLDALDQGFCSVEADLWLVEGELRVAHDLADARPGRTLQRLYLDPLRQRARANGGRVFRGGPPCTLLVDVKSDATNTYQALSRVLRRYDDTLTRFEENHTATNAVTVIISGNRARELMSSEKQRWAAYDGRLPDLQSADSPRFIPWISDNWMLQFRWKAGAQDGPFPEDERLKLRQLVDRVHAQGRRLRLWGAPDNAVAWQVLAEAGVDLINTDDLAGLAAFLRSKPHP